MRTPLGRRHRGPLHIGRYGEILSVLVRYGFGDILSYLNVERQSILKRLVGEQRKGRALARTVSRWERIRLAVEDLGPTFVKLGQFMSNRPDILPPELASELEKLQDSTRPFPAEEARKIVEQELKRPLADIFDDFSDTPIASASIAQVHKGRLRSGEEVAIKVQRPRIRQIIATDLDILFHLASLLERYYEHARALRVGQLVEEFERAIRKELDFGIEAAHMEAFRRNFKDEPRVCIPKVYDDFTTRRLLVTELVHGMKVSEIERLRRENIDTHEIAKRGADLVLKQVFDHGFFHADPHPGNILVKTDGTICFLDCGAVGILPPSLRYHIGVILYGVVSKDSERVARTLMRLSHRPVRSIEHLEHDIAEFIEEYSSLSLKKLHVAEVLQRFATLIVKHDLEIIPGFYLLLKSIVTIEGVGYRLDPDFNMIDNIEPHVRRLVRQNPRLKYLPYDVYFAAMDMASLLKEMPFEFKDLIRIVKAGETRIQFEHRGLEPLISKLDQSVNRLVFAVVVAALVVGSSIVIHADIPPEVFGISAIGIIGFCIAGLIGFGLLFSILRQKRL